MSKSGFAKQHLRSFIERIERLEEERAALTADIREVYSEAKGHGFDTKIMRQVVRLRKLDTADRQEQEAILDLYKSALGMGEAPLLRELEDEDDNRGGGKKQNAPRPSNRDVSADGKPSSEAGPQAEASHAGTGSETPAVHEGEREGVSPANVSADVTGGESAAPIFDLPAFLDRRARTPERAPA